MLQSSGIMAVNDVAMREIGMNEQQVDSHKGRSYPAEQCGFVIANLFKDESRSCFNCKRVTCL